MIRIQISGQRNGGKTATALAIRDALVLMGYRVSYIGHNNLATREFDRFRYAPEMVTFDSHVHIADLE